MAYIIGTFDKYDAWDREHAVYKFEVNGNWYAVKEIEMEWGLPKLPLYVDKDENPKQYFVYDTYEQALAFVHRMKSLN